MVIVSEPDPIEAQPEPAPSDTRLRWFELVLVLLVALANPIISSVDILRNGPPPETYLQNSRWGYQVVQEVICLLLLGYVLRRRKMRFRDLGLRWSWRGLGAAMLVTVIAYIAYAAGYALIHSIHHWMFLAAVQPSNASRFSPRPSFMVILLLLLNPFFEELIVRAYLMTEVKALTGSWTLAVALSVAIQTSYHLYYGWVVALSLSFQFLVWSHYYARTQKATPVVLAHGFFDFLALVRAW